MTKEGAKGGDGKVQRMMTTLKYELVQERLSGNTAKNKTQKPLFAGICFVLLCFSSWSRCMPLDKECALSAVDSPLTCRHTPPSPCQLPGQMRWLVDLGFGLPLYNPKLWGCCCFYSSLPLTFSLSLSLFSVWRCLCHSHGLTVPSDLILCQFSV